MVVARLIPPITGPGSLHMAIDSWVLDQHQQGRHPPCLRFYQWEPAAISLGYHQHHWPHHWHQLTWRGNPLDLVRRPSGGRSVLHQGDLTYALITSEALLPQVTPAPEGDDPASLAVTPVPQGSKGKRQRIYQTLCGFLEQGWANLGFPLQYGHQRQSSQGLANCFALSTPADLCLAQGQKWIGSAQLWRQGAVLQHGSMLLDPDPYLWEAVFGTPLDLESRPPSVPPIETIIHALSQAVRPCLGYDLVLDPFSPQEWQAIEAYAQTHPAHLTQ